MSPDPTAEKLTILAKETLHQYLTRNRSKALGSTIKIKFGELTTQKKEIYAYGQKRKLFKGSIQIEFVLDADGNLEWIAPNDYHYKTMYARKVFEDLRKVITSDPAHLHALNVMNRSLNSKANCLRLILK